jgi:pimeloyl-ACP methyl ester carboxylesterase
MPSVEIDASEIEYELIPGEPANSSAIVMLHEGLGSIAMWRDFPSRIARATRHSVLVHSRVGYGGSSPLKGKRSIHYMHTEALSVLPRLLDTLRIQRPVLLGHSDGGSIALIHAGGTDREVAGVIALAPHVFVEDISVESIQAARVAYETTDLRARLARYHNDVDGAFWGWNDIWLEPLFRNWNIETYLPLIRCPVLAIQGMQDEYGTLVQIDRIARQAAHVETLKLEGCRHSPHRDQPEAVLNRITTWIDRLRSPGSPPNPGDRFQGLCQK